MQGVDVAPQPNYCGDSFNQIEIFSAINEYRFCWPMWDLVWASPPCQGRTAYKRRRDHVSPVDTDGAIALMQRAFGCMLPGTVIENVPGARALLRHPVTLCGSMFGLDVRRHRLFQCSFPVEQPACRHDLQRGDFPQATNRANRRRTVEVGVWRIPLETQRAAMGVDWMSREELSQAIPPAYSNYLAKQFLKSKG